MKLGLEDRLVVNWIQDQEARSAAEAVAQQWDAWKEGQVLHGYDRPRTFGMLQLGEDTGLRINAVKPQDLSSDRIVRIIGQLMDIVTQRDAHRHLAHMFPDSDSE